MALLQQPPNYSAQFEKFEPVKSMIASDRAQQMGQESQLRQETQQANIDRFTEQSNLISVVEGAQKFLALPTGQTPEETAAIQNDFLQKRADEIKARGGDPRDTLETLAMTPEQRVEVANNVMKIGRDRGIIAQQAGGGKGGASRLIVKREVREGVDHFIGRNPITGEEVKDFGPAGGPGGKGGAGRATDVKTMKTTMLVDGKPMIVLQDKATGALIKTLGEAPKADAGVNVTIGDKEEAKLNTKIRYDAYNDARKNINSARKTIRAMDQMKVLVNNITDDSLLAAGAKIFGPDDAIKWANIYNVVADYSPGLEKVNVADIAAAESLGSANTLFAVGVRVEGSGQTSNYEMQLYKKTTASLDDSKQGMLKKIALLKLESVRRQQIAKKRMQLLAKDDKMTLFEIEEEIDKMLDADPYEAKVMKIMADGKGLKPGATPFKDAAAYKDVKKTMNYNPESGEFVQEEK